MTNAIETRALAKSFGKTRALDGIDLTVREGSVYGLLGPNGAGKTTTIRILATLLKPDGGQARVLGLDVVREPDAVRRKVGLTGQYASVDEDLTGLENLILVGRLLGLAWSAARRRAAELLDAFGLSEAAGRQVRTYSGGMRRRIDIGASLEIDVDRPHGAIPVDDRKGRKRVPGGILNKRRQFAPLGLRVNDGAHVVEQLWGLRLHHAERRRRAAGGHQPRARFEIALRVTEAPVCPVPRLRPSP